MMVQRPPATLYLSVGIVLLLLAAFPSAASSGVAGRVIAPDGKPVAGAVVDGIAHESTEAQADRHAAGRARAAVATARTGADGSFRIDSTQAILAVEARADGFAPAHAKVTGDGPVTLTLPRMAPRRGVIQSNGRPVPAAVVVWMSNGAETIVRTGGDGSYEIPGPESAPAILRVIHPDYAPLQEWLFGPGAKLDLALEAGLRIAGTVVDAAGSPVSGATLRVDGDLKAATTNAKGQFAIEHAQPGWSFLSARTESLAGAAARKSGPVVLTAKPARSVTGAVRDDKTGQPVAGSTVVATATATGFSATVDADARGQYTLAGLPPGRYRLYAGGDGFVSGPSDFSRAVPIDLREALSGRQDFALARLPRITGRVEDEEKRPVEGAAVSLNFKDTPPLYGGTPFEGMHEQVATRTAADGSFSLQMPADGGRNELLKDASVMALKAGYAAGQADGKAAAGRNVTIRLTRGVELKGRVTGPDGAPLPGVAVTVAEDGTFAGTMMPMFMVLANTKGEGWTATDAAGQFSMRVRPASHHLSFRKAGHAPKVVRGHDPRAGGVEVALEPAAVVRGVVTRADGSGVSGAAVSATQQMSALSAAASTGKDGAFEIGDLSAGLYVLSVTHADLGIQMTRTVEAPATDVEFVLGPAGTLQGRVADAVTGQPVTHFKIELEPDDASGRQEREVSIDDAGGAFAIADVPVGDVAVVVSAPGYAARRTEATVTAEAGAPGLEVALDAEAPITGRVTSDGRTAVPEARVAVERDGKGQPASATTDDDGLYELAGVAAGPVTLNVTAQGFLPEKRTLDTRESPRADVTLRKGLSLRGEVVSQGTPVADAAVMAKSSVQGATYQTAQTDERGRFTLEGMVPGRYTVSAFAADKGKAKVEDVDVEKSAPLRLVLERGATAVLTGTVVGMPAGEEAGVVVVMVTGDEGTAHGMVDAAHAFRIEDAPAGRVQARAMASYMSGTSRTSRAVELTLTAGTETDTVLRFAGDAVISGLVVRDGAPVPGVTVAFAAPDQTGTAGSTDSRGSYEVRGLEPGMHQVSVSGADAAFTTSYQVTGSGQFDIDITGGSVTGRAVRADDGTPLGSVAVVLFRESETTPATSTTTSAQGAFSARSLREGSYRLITAKPGFGQVVRQVEVPRGGTTDVLLELTEADGISVTVLDARDNRPLDAIVVVRDLARQIVANQHSGVGADGVLNIPLAPGSYLLSTSASGYGTVTRPVSSPAQGLRIGLTPGGTLAIESPRDLRGRVRLIQPDGEEYVRCWCNGIAEIQLKGRFTSIENVTPGSYTVELVDAPETAKPVLIREGQTSTVTFE